MLPFRAGIRPAVTEQTYLSRVRRHKRECSTLIRSPAAEFGIAGTGRDSWIVGVINSAPYLASAGLGCWLSDPLNRFFGRRGTIFITGMVLIATPIASGFTRNWQQLFVVRLILGLGMGAKGSTVPVLAAENAPAVIRGALVMTWQLWTAFGRHSTIVPGRHLMLASQAFSSVSRLTSSACPLATTLGDISLVQPSSQPFHCSSSTSYPNLHDGS